MNVPQAYDRACLSFRIKRYIENPVPLNIEADATITTFLDGNGVHDWVFLGQFPVLELHLSDQEMPADEIYSRMSALLDHVANIPSIDTFKFVHEERGIEFRILLLVLEKLRVKSIRVQWAFDWGPNAVDYRRYIHFVRQNVAQLEMVNWPRLTSIRSGADLHDITQQTIAVMWDCPLLNELDTAYSDLDERLCRAILAYVRSNRHLLTWTLDLSSFFIHALIPEVFWVIRQHPRIQNIRCVGYRLKPYDTGLLMDAIKGHMTIRTLRVLYDDAVDQLTRTGVTYTLSASNSWRSRVLVALISGNVLSRLGTNSLLVRTVDRNLIRLLIQYLTSNGM